MNLAGLGTLVLGAAALFAPRRVAIIVDTYEGEASKPILTHTFYGRDAAQARAVMAAHMKTDRFFAECSRGRFTTAKGSFACRNVERER